MTTTRYDKNAKNVLGQELVPCSLDPVTGFYRNGCCETAGVALSEDGDCFDRTDDSHISRIRKKLGPAAGGLIKTIWGIGYRCDVTES